MWDLGTINELNAIASEEAGQGKPQREALRKILGRDGRPRYYVPTVTPAPGEERGCNSVVE